jgi:hypothetical protein
MGQNVGRNAINASNANFIIVLEISQQMHINQISWEPAGNHNKCL